jgi:hypothetical protein
MNNPIWPDAHPWDMWFFVAVAALIAVVNRKTMLDRRLGATDVVPGTCRSRAETPDIG